MQRDIIQLPASDFLDVWDFTRLIAKAICPSLREGRAHSWLQKKLETQPDSIFDVQSELTDLEREALLRLLPGLPPSPGLSEADRRIFMDAYLNHPSRFSWRPVFVSEEEVLANSYKGHEIQEKHLRALQKEIAAGSIKALDQHHLSETRVGKNIFIHRADALRYLQQQHLQASETLPTSTEKNMLKPTRLTRRTSPTANSTGPSQEENIAAQRRPTDTEVPPSDGRIGPATDPGASTCGDRVAARAQNSSRQQGKNHDKGHLASGVGSGPPASSTILRRRQVEERTALSRSAIYEKLDPDSPRHDPSFPKQMKLGRSSVGWLESEIEAWLRSRTRVTR